jgi:hypothetical protein
MKSNIKSIKSFIIILLGIFVLSGVFVFAQNWGYSEPELQDSFIFNLIDIGPNLNQTQSKIRINLSNPSSSLEISSSSIGFLENNSRVNLYFDKIGENENSYYYPKIKNEEIDEFLGLSSWKRNILSSNYHILFTENKNIAIGTTTAYGELTLSNHTTSTPSSTVMNFVVLPTSSAIVLNAYYDKASSSWKFINKNMSAMGIFFEKDRILFGARATSTEEGTYFKRSLEITSQGDIIFAGDLYYGFNNQKIMIFKDMVDGPNNCANDNNLEGDTNWYCNRFGSVDSDEICIRYNDGIFRIASFVDNVPLELTELTNCPLENDNNNDNNKYMCFYGRILGDISNPILRYRCQMGQNILTNSRSQLKVGSLIVENLEVRDDTDKAKVYAYIDNNPIEIGLNQTFTSSTSGINGINIEVIFKKVVTSSDSFGYIFANAYKLNSVVPWKDLIGALQLEVQCPDGSFLSYFYPRRGRGVIEGITGQRTYQGYEIGAAFKCYKVGSQEKVNSLR